MKGSKLLSEVNTSPTYAIVTLDLGRLAVTTMPFPVVTAGRLKTISNRFTKPICTRFAIFTYNILDFKIKKYKKENIMRRRRRRVRRAVRMPGGFLRWIIIIVVVILLGIVCRMVFFR